MMGGATDEKLLAYLREPPAATIVGRASRKNVGWVI